MYMEYIIFINLPKNIANGLTRNALIAYMTNYTNTLTDKQ